MQIIIATPPGILDNGKHVMLFPSRCDWVGEFPPGTSYYPYELAYLSSLLKRETDHDVTMLDGCVTHTSAADYTRQIAEFAPDILITECGHLTYPTMTRIMQYVKPGRAILTGPFGMAFSELAQADGWEVVTGEYETKILGTITGWGYPVYPDLDWLPLPENDDIDRMDYYEEACIDRGVIQAYTSRGCPLACPFCVVPMYSNRHHRTRSPELICDEIETLVDQYGDRFTGLFINDEYHNADRGWLKQVAQTLIDRGLNRYHYDAMCSSFGWNEETIKIMAQAGYRQIRVGIETLDEQAGKGIHKRVIPARLRQLLEWCKEYGIRVHGTAIVGLPESSRDADMRTLETLLEMKADGLWHSCQHSPATPNPGTQFYNTAKANGWLTTDNLEDYHWRNVVVSYPHYSREQIEEVRQMYYLLRSEVRRGDNGDLLLVS